MAHPRGRSESSEEDAGGGVAGDARCTSGGRMMFDHEQLAVEPVGGPVPAGSVVAHANCQACDALDRLQRHEFDRFLQSFRVTWSAFNYARILYAEAKIDEESSSCKPLEGRG